ncbi:hypothetical protein GYB62_02560 [bacterium]|nr:hypothetical protein [bacterium]
MQAKHTGIHKPAAKEPELLKDAQTETNPLKRVTQSIIDQTQALWGDSPNDESAQAPSTLGAIMRSVDIVHDRITRARMAGEPADIVLSPRLGEIHSLDFAKMDEAYEAGVTSVDLHEAALRYEFASLAHPVD